MNSTRYPTSFLLLLPLFLADGPGLHAQAELVDGFEVDQVIHDIAFRNSMEGYAIAHQEILLTGDGGATWKRTDQLMFRTPFRSIALFGESGLIIGDVSGEVHIATNASVSAEPFTFNLRTHYLVDGDVKNEDKPVTEIGVVDGAHWVVIAGSVIYMTRDSGFTFTATPSPNGRLLTALDITSAELMHVSERDGAVLRSTDGGETWHPLEGLQHGFGIIYDVLFLSSDTGFVASWYPWNLFTTVDGGVTWTNGPFEYPTSIAVSTNGFGAYTTTGYMRVSHDRGMTWNDSIPLRAPDDDPFNEYHYQKVITAGDDRIFVLMSKSETNRSVIARIDVASDVKDKGYRLPDEIDLSLHEPSTAMEGTNHE